MTELEQVRAMFERAGIVYTIGNDDLEHWVNTESGTSPANLGYWGFGTTMTFDAEGKLKSIGAWE